MEVKTPSANDRYFVSGISTDIGKTIISAILVEKLKAHYWKPIQSGNTDNTDTDLVKSLVSNSLSQFFPESIVLKNPYSPHKAADLENRRITLSEIEPPLFSGPFICEGAGGLMVPLNENETQISLIRKLNFPIILISKNYLGSINHTLLSISKIQQENLTLKGIIFNGDHDPYTEDFILKFSNIEYLGRIPTLTKINPNTIREAGSFINI